MNPDLAPIVVFAFDRPEHLRITLEHLASDPLASQSKLYIFCDGAKPDSSLERVRRIDEVQRVANSQDWAGQVIVRKSETNKGLARNIFSGVTEIVNEFGKIVVLEDDLRIGKGFLTFMNEGLEKFKESEQVKQVSGFRFPFELGDESTSFFMPVTNTIGWGTWKRAWDEVDSKGTGYEVLKSDSAMMRRFNLDNSYNYSRILIGQLEQGKNDSWGILLWWSVFKNDGLVLYPGYTLIQHNDFGNLGVHKSNFDHYDLPGWSDEWRESGFPELVEVDEEAFQKMKRYIRHHTKTSLVGMIKKIFTKLRT